jgi:hypothetical protein
MNAAPVYKSAGKCVADCGGFLDRGDAIYWLVGGLILAVLLTVGAMHLSRRKS